MTPVAQALTHRFSTFGYRWLMWVRMKVAPYRFKGSKELLCSAGRFEVAHAPLPNSSRPVRILRSIVQTLVLSISDAWNQLFLSGSIASEFVSDDDPGGKANGLQQLAEEFLRRSFIAMALHQDIEDLTVGIDSAPRIILLAFKGDHSSKYHLSAGLERRRRI
jgi:hypothetical protein